MHLDFSATGEASADNGPEADAARLFRTIVHSANGGIWVLDVDGGTLFANPRMAEMLQLAPEEMIGLSILDVLDDLGRTQGAAVLQQERELRGTVEQVQCLFIRRDGSPLWSLVNRSPLLDVSGRHIGSINLVSDITDRRQVDEELRLSEQQLAQAQRVAHLGSWEWDISTDEIHGSVEMYRIFGLPEGTVGLGAWMDRVHVEDRLRVEGLLADCLGGAAELNADFRVVRRSGETLWIHSDAEMIRDEFGDPLTLRGTTLDITAYKATEDELQRTTARYHLLQKMATIANETSDFADVLQLAVTEICRHADWPVGRCYLVGREPRRLTPLSRWSVSAPNHQVLAERLSSGEDENGVTGLAARVFAVGRQLWRAAPVGPSPADAERDSRDRYAGFAFPVLVAEEVVAVLEFASAASDQAETTLLETWEQVGAQLARVFERQQGSDEVATARDEAMRSNRLKSEFLANMSHEIRTPMNGVIGLTSLLLATPMSDVQRRYAEGVQAAGAALLAVINDILDISKLEADKVELESADFDVRTVVEDVGMLLDPEARAKGLELLIRTSAEVPSTLRGDGGRIRQILLNLASNAVKFTPSGRVSIEVSSSVAEAGDVLLRVEITDTGIGIAEEGRERLFTSFSQADASTTRRYGGTGLGLAICQRLVEAMGGTIGFDSEVGTGSRFWFAVPVSHGATATADVVADTPSDRLAPADPPASPPGATVSLGCVLVVEDNPVNQLVAEGVVGSLGYEVEMVNNGVEALQALHHGHYAAVLMDCHMPVMDGFQATTEIRRRQGAGARVPVIAMTASAMSEDRQRCLDAGMDDFVTKPVSPEAIRAALGRAHLIGLHPAPAPLLESPLDHERLAALRQLGSLSTGADLLQRLAELYAQDSPLSLAAIRHAIISDEPANLYQALHKLVGTSANIGARRVVALCRSFEEQVAGLDADRGQQLLAELELEVSWANEALEDALLKA